MIQSSNSLVLVKPASFGYDEISAKTNSFQSNNNSKKLFDLVKKEHFELTKLLDENNIAFQILNSSKECLDGIFPNNWVITYIDKTYDLFSMLNPNRRLERTKENINFLQKAYSPKNDFSTYEKDNQFLEGTGSLVLDRINKIAYMSVSKRSSVKLATHWANRRGYTLNLFSSYLDDVPIYHTNVVMFIGSNVACLGSDLIKENTIEALLKKHHSVITLSKEEVMNFCGNCIEVRDRENNKILLMSSRAYSNFSKKNLLELSSFYPKILHTNLTNIENVGGGSLRCMILELF
ncbi:arginine deiminase-related protein [Gammaproteobacteria bacterium]|nr:arginine deiminase-related protein [Gammaproteobacteria bacterium]